MNGQTLLRPSRKSMAAFRLGALIVGGLTLLSSPSTADVSFEGVPAVIQRYQQTPGDTVMINNRPVHADGYLLRVDDQTSVLGLSLDPRIPSATARYKLAPSTTPGIGPIASALWLHDHASTVGKPLANGDMETAAIQAAVWVKGGSLKATPADIPNNILRTRVSQLAAAAPSDVSDAPEYPTGFAFTSVIRRVDANWVTVALVAIQSRETTFDQQQKIDLRVDGHWAVVKSGQRTDVQTVHGRTRATRSGGAPDRNTALVRIPRGDDALPLDARWNLDIDSATVFVGDANQPALVTFGPIKLTLPQQLTLNPSDYPTPQHLVGRWFESVWRHLGWFKWPAVLLALWLLPNLALLLNRVGAWLWAHRRDLSHRASRTNPGQRAKP